MSEHLSSEEIQDYFDGALTGAEKGMVERHIASCRACASILHAIGEVDRTLRTLPVEKAPDRFTQEVMKRIPLKAETPFAFRVLERLAYVFALFVVLAVLGAVFVMTGVIGWGDVESGGTFFQEVFDESSGAMNAVLSTFGSWIAQYLPFAFGAGTLGITGAIVAVVLLLAVLDGILGRKLMNRVG